MSLLNSVIGGASTGAMIGGGPIGGIIGGVLGLAGGLLTNKEENVKFTPEIREMTRVAPSASNASYAFQAKPTQFSKYNKVVMVPQTDTTTIMEQILNLADNV